MFAAMWSEIYTTAHTLQYLWSVYCHGRYSVATSNVMLCTQQQNTHSLFVLYRICVCTILWVWVPPEAANFSWLFRASCVLLLCLSVVLLLLRCFSQHLLKWLFKHIVYAYCSVDIVMYSVIFHRHNTTAITYSLQWTLQWTPGRLWCPEYHVYPPRSGHLTNELLMRVQDTLLTVHDTSQTSAGHLTNKCRTPH